MSTQRVKNLFVLCWLVGGVLLGHSVLGFSETPSYAGTVLRYITITNPFVDTMRELVPEFERETGIKVKIEEYEHRTLHQKALLDAASRTADYDILGIDIVYMGRFAEGNFIFPTEEWLRRDWDEIGGDQLVEPGLYSVNGYHNVNYGIPAAVYNIILYYRKDLFEKEGISVPRTWKEYEKVARSFTRKFNPASPTPYGVAMMTKRGVPIIHEWIAYLWAFGGYIYDENLRPSVNSKEGIAAAEFYKNLIKYAPPGVVDYAYDEKIAALTTGKVPMIIAWSAWGPTVEDPAKSEVSGKLGYARIPSKPGIKFAPFGGWSMCINRYSKHKEAAWEWMKWFAKKDVQISYAEKGTGGPIRKDVLAMPILQEKFPWFKPILESADYADLAPNWYRSIDRYVHFRTRNPFYAQFEDIFGRELNAAMTGLKPVKEALDDANAEYYEVLKTGGFCK